MRSLFGANVLTHRKRDSLPKRLAGAFINPFTAVLAALALISFVTDYLIAAPQDRDLTAVIIVEHVIVINQRRSALSTKIPFEQRISGTP